MGYPGHLGSHLDRRICSSAPSARDNRGVDPIVLVIALVILMPLATLWALARSSKLRGPVARPEPRGKVGTLVTDVIPEEHPEPDDDTEPGPDFRIDSEPTEPDADLP